MSYLNTNARTVKPTGNEQFQTLGRMPSLFGVFVGIVKQADDVQRNGRLRVWIPEFGTAPDEQQGWITVNYCSPFAGATNVETNSKSNLESFEGTQTSYGMWMIPPDINNQVLVMFVAGDAARGIWIGSYYDQFMNNMVPATAADVKSYQYPGNPVPVAEYNKWDKRVTQPDRALKPYAKTKFMGLGNQGLIRDELRGITNSSARRESPSNVYGILTPGPVIDKSAAPADIRRKGGSSFIMDDGNCTEYVELSTKSGSKIRLDESNGFVYLINRDGTGWIQMDADGNVDIFSAKNISLRAQRDFNIRADRNINIEAGQNVFIKAAKDTIESTVPFTYDVNNVPVTKQVPVWNNVGEGNGHGGNIATHALNNWHSTSQQNAFITVVDNNLDIRVNNSYLLTTVVGGQDYNSKMGIKMTTEAAMDLGAKGNIRIGTNALLSATADGDIVMCTSAAFSQSSASNMVITAGGKLSVDATGVDIGTAVKMPSLDAGSIKSGSLDSGSVVSNTIARDGRPLGGGGPAAPSAASTLSPINNAAPLSAAPARRAEVKPLNDKINILATWADPDSKFNRDYSRLQTTVSRFPTYEPCPEHTSFKLSAIGNYAPQLTEDDKTYEGSGGAGNSATAPAAACTGAGKNNSEIAADPTPDNVASKDFNAAAFKCQIKQHEGVELKSYVDRTGLSAGVGHFLRVDEILKYPLGTPVSMEQVNTWLEQDTVTSLKIAQTLFKGSWSSLSDVRKRALVDLSYNLGQPRLSKFTKFIDAMDKQQFDVAAQELRNSRWFTQVGRRGQNIITMISQNVDPTACGSKFPG